MLVNAGTGLYCRVAPLPADSNRCTTQGLVCDAASAAEATALTWTGNGFTYQGIPFSQLADGTMVFSSDPLCVVPSSEEFSAVPVTPGEPLAALHGQPALGMTYHAHRVHQAQALVANASLL
jgi:hypothetical protein